MWLVGSLLPEALPDYMVNPVLSSCCNTGFKENIAFVQATHNDDNATSLLQPWRHTKVFLFLRQFIGDEIIVNWLESKGEYMSKKSETVYPGIWGILKLSVLVNQKVFKTVYQNIKSTFFGQC